MAGGGEGCAAIGAICIGSAVGIGIPAVGAASIAAGVGALAVPIAPVVRRIGCIRDVSAVGTLHAIQAVAAYGGVSMNAGFAAGLADAVIPDRHRAVTVRCFMNADCMADPALAVVVPAAGNCCAILNTLHIFVMRADCVATGVSAGGCAAYAILPFAGLIRKTVFG